MADDILFPNSPELKRCTTCDAQNVDFVFGAGHRTHNVYEGHRVMSASLTMTTTREQNLLNSAPVKKLRYPHLVRYVVNDEVEQYQAQGWEWTSALVDTHHGEHATLMVWPHDTDPPNG